MIRFGVPVIPRSFQRNLRLGPFAGIKSKFLFLTKSGFVRILTVFSISRKAQKLSQASDKQKRINELLNASHNSQAERDYLRKQILKIFEEDEKALEDLAKDVPPRQRKHSFQGVISEKDEGFHEVSEGSNPGPNGSTNTSGFGELQSRSSLQFIDVKEGVNKVGE